MEQSKMIDLNKMIGIYTLSNTISVAVYEIDYVEDQVLAGMVGENPAWCPIVEEYDENTDTEELGFKLGELFVPFYDVLRFWS